MAKRFKIKTNFSYKKLALKMPDIMEKQINILGNFVNKAIQDGIDSGVDIKGRPFKSLSTRSTTQLRSGSTPLKSRGILRKTKKTPATGANPVFKIEMVGKSQATLPMLKGKKVKRSKAGQQYGAFHNQKGGYTTSPSSAIPNRKVPQRQWFGISKSVLPGGKDYKKSSLIRRLEIAKAVRTIWKFK